MKHSQDIKTIQNIRTLRGERQGSIPQKGRSQFLELYLYQKEKERLEQEIGIMTKKIDLNQKKLSKTIANINRMRKLINAQENDQEQGKLIPLEKHRNIKNRKRSKK